MTETMNIHKALSEVKILNNRIIGKISECQFCVANKVTNKTIKGKSIDEWKNSVQDNWTSITTLINRRNALKQAISKSNASTEVTIAGKVYTVAEAIEMKQYGMDYYNALLNELRNDFSEANRSVEKTNTDADIKATDYAQNCVGSDKSNTESLREIEKIRTAYYDSHKAELIDPIDITNKIAELEEQISSFTSEVDSVLSVSNATTFITIEY